MACSRQSISSASRGRRGAAVCGRRQLRGRDDQALDDRLAADLEHAVELGDRARARRDARSPSPGRFPAVAGFGQQSQPRQIGQQAAEHGLQAARGDDPLRIAAAAQGHVQQRLLGQASAAACGQTRAHAGRVAAQHAPPAPPRPAAPRPPAVGRRRRLVHRPRGSCRAASAVSTQAAMICSSSVSLTLRRRSYSTSDSCVPRGGGIR